MIKKSIIISIAGVLLFSGCSSKIEHGLIKVPPSVKLKKIEKPSFYEIQRKKELAKVIQEKNMPIKTEDKVLRILVMPYVDKDNVLHSQNFHYTTVEKGKWILGEYLLGNESHSVKELTPLQKTKR